MQCHMLPLNMVTCDKHHVRRTSPYQNLVALLRKSEVGQVFYLDQGIESKEAPGSRQLCQQWG